MVIGDDFVRIARAQNGDELGGLAEEGASELVPPSLAAALEGAFVEVEIPAAWVWRRALNPISTESAPFAEAFARHQIERVTPWRSDDAYFRVATAPLGNDPSRLSVDIDVVGRRMVDETLRGLAQARPRQLQLLTRRGEETIVLPTSDLLPQRHGAERRWVLAGVIAVALVFASWSAFVFLRIGAVQDEIAALDRQIEDRRADASAASTSGLHAGDPSEALRRARRTSALAVQTLEALTSALPDHAYLTDFALKDDNLQISGLSSQASDVAPALERSLRFAEVTFSAPTTREETGGLDRFHLDMRVVGAAPAPRPAPQSPN